MTIQDRIVNHMIVLFSSEKYYFVRSKNKSISATAPDVMIKKKSKTYMNLNDGMDAANKHTSYEHI